MQITHSKLVIFISLSKEMDYYFDLLPYFRDDTSVSYDEQYTCKSSIIHFTPKLLLPELF